MKAFILLLFVVAFSHVCNAQIPFYYKDCLNKWSPFTSLGGTVTARVAFIRNSANDSWMIQFVNNGNTSVAFNYTAFGSTSLTYTKAFTMQPHSVTPIVHADPGIGCSDQCDLFISISFPGQKTLKKKL